METSWRVRLRGDQDIAANYIQVSKDVADDLDPAEYVVWSDNTYYHMFGHTAGDLPNPYYSALGDPVYPAMTPGGGWDRVVRDPETGWVDRVVTADMPIDVQHLVTSWIDEPAFSEEEVLAHGRVFPGSVQARAERRNVLGEYFKLGRAHTNKDAIQTLRSFHQILRLELAGCWNITRDIFPVIVAQFPLLLGLRLVGCPGISARDLADSLILQLPSIFDWNRAERDYGKHAWEHYRDTRSSNLLELSWCALVEYAKPSKMSTDESHHRMRTRRPAPAAPREKQELPEGLLDEQYLVKCVLRTCRNLLSLTLFHVHDMVEAGPELRYRRLPGHGRSLMYTIPENLKLLRSLTLARIENKNFSETDLDLAEFIPPSLRSPVGSLNAMEKGRRTAAEIYEPPQFLHGLVALNLLRGYNILAGYPEFARSFPHITTLSFTNQGKFYVGDGTAYLERNRDFNCYLNRIIPDLAVYHPHLRHLDISWSCLTLPRDPPVFARYILSLKMLRVLALRKCVFRIEGPAPESEKGIKDTLHLILRDLLFMPRGWSTGTVDPAEAITIFADPSLQVENLEQYRGQAEIPVGLPPGATFNGAFLTGDEYNYSALGFQAPFFPVMTFGDIFNFFDEDPQEPVPSIDALYTLTPAVLVGRKIVHITKYKYAADDFETDPITGEPVMDSITGELVPKNLTIAATQEAWDRMVLGMGGQAEGFFDMHTQDSEGRWHARFRAEQRVPNEVPAELGVVMAPVRAPARVAGAGKAPAPAPVSPEKRAEGAEGAEGKLAPQLKTEVGASAPTETETEAEAEAAHPTETSWRVRRLSQEDIAANYDYVQSDTAATLDPKSFVVWSDSAYYAKYDFKLGDRPNVHNSPLEASTRVYAPAETELYQSSFVAPPGFTPEDMQAYGNAFPGSTQDRVRTRSVNGEFFKFGRPWTTLTGTMALRSFMHINRLELAGCWNVTPDIFAVIVAQFPNLVGFRFIGCSQISIHYVCDFLEQLCAKQESTQLAYREAHNAWVERSWDRASKPGKEPARPPQLQELAIFTPHYRESVLNRNGIPKWQDIEEDAHLGVPSELGLVYCITETCKMLLTLTLYHQHILTIPDTETHFEFTNAVYRIPGQLPLLRTLTLSCEDGPVSLDLRRFIVPALPSDEGYSAGVRHRVHNLTAFNLMKNYEVEQGYVEFAEFFPFITTLSLLWQGYGAPNNLNTILPRIPKCHPNLKSLDISWSILTVYRDPSIFVKLISDLRNLRVISLANCHWVVWDRTPADTSEELVKIIESHLFLLGKELLFQPRGLVLNVQGFAESITMFVTALSIEGVNGPYVPYGLMDTIRTAYLDISFAPLDQRQYPNGDLYEKSEYSISALGYQSPFLPSHRPRKWQDVFGLPPSLANTDNLILFSARVVYIVGRRYVSNDVDVTIDPDTGSSEGAEREFRQWQDDLWNKRGDPKENANFYFYVYTNEEEYEGHALYREEQRTPPAAGEFVNLRLSLAVKRPAKEETGPRLEPEPEPEDIGGQAEVEAEARTEAEAAAAAETMAVAAHPMETSWRFRRMSQEDIPANYTHEVSDIAATLDPKSFVVWSDSAYYAGYGYKRGQHPKPHNSPLEVIGKADAPIESFLSSWVAPPGFTPEEVKAYGIGFPGSTQARVYARNVRGEYFKFVRAWHTMEGMVALRSFAHIGRLELAGCWNVTPDIFTVIVAQFPRLVGFRFIGCQQISLDDICIFLSELRDKQKNAQLAHKAAHDAWTERRMNRVSTPEEEPVRPPQLQELAIVTPHYREWVPNDDGTESREWQDIVKDVYLGSPSERNLVVCIMQTCKTLLTLTLHHRHDLTVLDTERSYWPKNAVYDIPSQLPLLRTLTLACENAIVLLDLSRFIPSVVPHFQHNLTAFNLMNGYEVNEGYTEFAKSFPFITTLSLLRQVNITERLSTLLPQISVCHPNLRHLDLSGSILTLYRDPSIFVKWIADLQNLRVVSFARCEWRIVDGTPADTAEQIVDWINDNLLLLGKELLFRPRGLVLNLQGFAESIAIFLPAPTMEALPLLQGFKDAIQAKYPNIPSAPKNQRQYPNGEVYAGDEYFISALGYQSPFLATYRPRLWQTTNGMPYNLAIDGNTQFSPDFVYMVGRCYVSNDVDNTVDQTGTRDDTQDRVRMSQDTLWSRRGNADQNTNYYFYVYTSFGPVCREEQRTPPAAGEFVIPRLSLAVERPVNAAAVVSDISVATVAPVEEAAAAPVEEAAAAPVEAAAAAPGIDEATVQRFPDLDDEVLWRDEDAATAGLPAPMDTSWRVRARSRPDTESEYRYIPSVNTAEALAHDPRKFVVWSDNAYYSKFGHKKGEHPTPQYSALDTQIQDQPIRTEEDWRGFKRSMRHDLEADVDLQHYQTAWAVEPFYTAEEVRAHGIAFPGSVQARLRNRMANGEFFKFGRAWNDAEGRRALVSFSGIRRIELAGCWNVTPAIFQTILAQFPGLVGLRFVGCPGISADDLSAFLFDLSIQHTPGAGLQELAVCTPRYFQPQQQSGNIWHPNGYKPTDVMEYRPMAMFDSPGGRSEKRLMEGILESCSQLVMLVIQHEFHANDQVYMIPQRLRKLRSLTLSCAAEKVDLDLEEFIPQNARDAGIPGSENPGAPPRFLHYLLAFNLVHGYRVIRGYPIFAKSFPFITTLTLREQGLELGGYKPSHYCYLHSILPLLSTCHPHLRSLDISGSVLHFSNPSLPLSKYISALKNLRVLSIDHLIVSGNGDADRAEAFAEYNRLVDALLFQPRGLLIDKKGKSDSIVIFAYETLPDTAMKDSETRNVYSRAPSSQKQYPNGNISVDQEYYKSARGYQSPFLSAIRPRRDAISSLNSGLVRITTADSLLSGVAVNPVYTKGTNSTTIIVGAKYVDNQAFAPPTEHFAMGLTMIDYWQELWLQKKPLNNDEDTSKSQTVFFFDVYVRADVVPGVTVKAEPWIREEQRAPAPNPALVAEDERIARAERGERIARAKREVAELRSQLTSPMDVHAGTQEMVAVDADDTAPQASVLSMD